MSEIKVGDLIILQVKFRNRLYYIPGKVSHVGDVVINLMVTHECEHPFTNSTSGLSIERCGNYIFTKDSEHEKVIKYNKNIFNI